MKYSNKSVTQEKNILANDHFVAIPYDCTSLSALATGGVIKAGTIIPANGATAVGVLLNSVNLTENPNGTIVIHGFIKSSKLDAQPTTEAITALAKSGVVFIDDSGVPKTA